MKGKILVSFGLGAICTSSFALMTSSFNFDGSLNPVFNNGHAGALEFYKGGASPVANGTPTYVTDTVGSVTKQVASFAMTEGFKVFHGIGINGGGDGVNIYTIMYDIKLTATHANNYASLLQANATNSNDGDLFFKQGSGLGTIGDYSNSTPPFMLNTWHRLVASFDLVAGAVNIYVDGNLANTVALTNSIDGGWSPYAYNDSSPVDHLWILMDEDGENGSGYISQLAFWDTALTQSEVQALGGVGQPVPEPATMVALSIGALGLVARRRRK